MENYKNKGLLYWSGPLKITKLPIQHSMLGHHRPASELPFKSITANSGIWILPPLIKLKKKTKKNVVKVGLPLTKLSGSAHEKNPS